VIHMPGPQIAREYLICPKLCETVPLDRHDKLWDLSELDDICINELTTPKWSENSSGQIEVAKREKIVARLKRSPDNASSLILAPFVPQRSSVGEEVLVSYTAGRRQ
jgi:hypothetical protein